MKTRRRLTRTGVFKIINVAPNGFIGVVPSVRFIIWRLIPELLGGPFGALVIS